VIYCINPGCYGRENIDAATNCASCGTLLLIENRLTLIKKISSDEDIEVYEVIDRQKTFCTSAGSIKILKILKNLDSDRLQAFRNEADILQSLIHEGIPKVDALYDFFYLDILASDRRIYCLVMTKVEGVTLDQYVAINGAISQKKAIDFLQQLANILHYIHTIESEESIGIIHRDIKPSNIIVQPNGRLALIDFGFALRMSLTYRLQLSTGEISRVESLYYTPPEQVERKPILQSDYYALGMTLIFAITGKDLYTIGPKKKSWNLDWEKYANVDKPLLQLLEQLTELNPLKRPATPDDFLIIINQTLPDNLKLYSRFKSKTFRISALAIITLAIAGLLQLGRVIVADHYLDDGNKALNEGRSNDAKGSYELAVKINPSGDAYNNLGLACSLLGELDCEKQSLEKAIKLAPENWVSYYRLGQYNEDKVEPDYLEAERLYRKAIDLSHSKVLLPINNLARILLLNQDLKQVEDFQKFKDLIHLGLSLSKDKQSEALLRRSLGWMYLEQKDYKNAEDSLVQATKLDKTLVSPYCLLAKVYDAENRPSTNEVQSCMYSYGRDSLNIEVLRWRQERRDKNRSL
jgi:serine/threonine protein kinase